MSMLVGCPLPTNNPVNTPANQPAPIPAPVQPAPAPAPATVPTQPAPESTQKSTQKTRVLEIKASQKADYVFVFLHGRSSNADDLYPIAADFAKTFPNVDMLLPDAFHPSPNGNGTDYEWWSIQNISDISRPERITTARTELEEWLDTILKTRNISRDKLVLLGFSQGAALSVETGRQQSIAGVVAWCGKGIAIPKTVKNNTTTPFLMVNGGQDPLIAATDATAYAKSLQESGAKVTFKMHEKLAHAIDRSVIEESRVFLQQIVKR